MYMTPEQLHELSGLRQSAAQIRWLKTNRLQHWVRADGKPRVPVDERGNPLPVAETGSVQEVVQPDFGVLRGAR